MTGMVRGLLLVAMWVADARARAATTACPGGAFALAAADEARIADAYAGLAAVGVTLAPGGTVTLGPCVAKGTVHAKRHATVLKARFAVCGGVPNVQLFARIAAPACGTLAGRVRAHRHPAIAFTATRSAASTTVTSTTTPTVSTTTTTTVPHVPRCGDGRVDAGEACDGVVGCGPGDRCDDSCVCVPLPPPPVLAQTLIANALADGTIDLPTSLLYRGWALMQDSALPAQFLGEAGFWEDADLGPEIDALLADPSTSVTPEMTTALQAFSVRPNDPQSYFTAHPASPATGAPASGALVSRVRRAAEEKNGVPCPNADWRPYETAHFVIWSCGGGDAGQDTTGMQRGVAATIAEQVWTAMVPDTGPPKKDALAVGPAPTDRIDVYLVDTGNAECDPRRSVCKVFPAGALAYARVAGDCAGQQASGYIVAPVGDVPTTAPDTDTPTRFRGTFAHEFFHLIEYAHDALPVGYKCFGILPLPSGKRSWLAEASANWAEHEYFADDAAAEWNALFDGFQTDRLSLTAGDEMLTLLSNGLEKEGDDDWALRPYEAWLYLYFWEKSGGGKSAVISLWADAGGVDSQGLTDLLDGRFGFFDHFRDFSVRNVNEDLTGDPIDPLWKEVEPRITSTAKPRYFREPIEVGVELNQLDRPTGIDPAAALYETYKLDDAIRYLKLDFTKVDGSGDLTFDIVAHEHGDDPTFWKRRQFQGAVVEFCRDQQGWDYDEFHLVVSNTRHKLDANVTDPYQITAQEQCPEHWSGSITVTTSIDETRPYSETHGRERQRWSVSGSGHGTPPGLPPGSMDLDYVDLAWTADDQLSDVSNDPSAQCPYSRSETGTGSATTRAYITSVPGKPARIYLDPGTMLHPYDITVVTDACVETTVTNQGAEQLEVALAGVAQAGGFVSDQGDVYAGHFTTIDSDETFSDGGEQILNQHVEWDLERSLASPK